MELIYIITHKCNLNCLYCPVKQKNLSISKKIIADSLALVQDKKIKKVKLFGGEPLLKYSELQYLVNKIGVKRPGLKITLTTNGILLNKQIVNWLKKSEVDLIISLDGNQFTQLKNRRGRNSFKNIISLLPDFPSQTVFNLVIAPNTVKYFFYNFKYLLGLGIRRFNFLPAYYNNWQISQIKIFQNNLEEILKYIKDNKLKQKIFLKNLENFSDLTFFNMAVVIDCDGAIYNTNAILAKQIEPYKQIFKIGDIKTFKIKNSVTQGKINIDKLISVKYSKINKQLDNILNNFIFNFKSL